jgi:hypothetical protein
MDSIFLKGIFKEDFEMDQDYGSINDLASDDEDLFLFPTEEYEKTPNHYYDKESWVPRTNIRCWHCFSKCPDRPWFVPINLNKITRGGEERDVIEAYGTFCYITCVKSFIKLHPDKINNAWTSEKLLHKICKDWIGDIKIIPESESPYLKKCFIGNAGLSESEYLEKNKNKIKSFMSPI